MADYSKMTDDDFENYLERVINDYYGNKAFDMISDFPEIGTLLREGLNNDVLDAWADDNPEKAYPEDYEKEDEDDL